MISSRRNVRDVRLSVDWTPKSDAEWGLAYGTPARLAYTLSRGGWQYAPHLQLMDAHLVALARRQITRLIITAPPRHGKSELCSRFFPAWFLGMFPNRRVMLTSYQAKFARQWGGKVRDIIQHSQHIYGITTRPDSTAKDEWNILDHDGGMVSAGRQSGITGRGAHLLIVDDPVASAAAAVSPTIQDAIWQWYVSTAETRLEPGAVVVIVMTRWSETDLVGRLLESQRHGGEQWTVLHMPALAVEPTKVKSDGTPWGPDPLGRAPGMALWPERFSAELLTKKRETRDDPAAGQVMHWFEALYQGDPSGARGEHFDTKWFTVVIPPAPPEGPCRAVRFWDKAATPGGGCNTAGALVVEVGRNKYIVDIVAGQWGPAERERVIRETAYRDGIGVEVCVEEEPGASGKDSSYWTVTNLEGFAVCPIRPSGEKSVRAAPMASQAQAGNLLMCYGAWNRDFLDEIRRYPRGGKDRVDAVAGAVNRLDQTKVAESASGGTRPAAPWNPAAGRSEIWRPQW